MATSGDFNLTIDKGRHRVLDAESGQLDEVVKCS